MSDDIPESRAEMIKDLLSERDELLVVLRSARRELSNYTTDCVGVKNYSVIDCITDIDAAIAKALGEQ